MGAFNYTSAFSRNLGWLTEAEQTKIRSQRVGILGAGGVGGHYAELLARLGVRKFVIWDPDTFSVENTNRQNECRVSNYGRGKAETIGALIRDINPDAEVDVHAEAMSPAHVDHFCQSIDFYFDGLDFFEIDVRIAIFRKLREADVPAVTVAPIGTGSASVVFTRDSMSFDDYFGLHTTTDPVERSFLFLTGIAPTLMQRKYVAEPGRVSFKDRAVPSLGIGVYASASLAVSLFLKLVLNRGPVRIAPWAFHYDPYLQKAKRRYVWLGYRNPVQRLKRWVAKQILRRQADA